MFNQPPYNWPYLYELRIISINFKTKTYYRVKSIANVNEELNQCMVILYHVAEEIKNYQNIMSYIYTWSI
jgi:hypothetical protein